MSQHTLRWCPAVRAVVAPARRVPGQECPHCRERLPAEYQAVESNVQAVVDVAGSSLEPSVDQDGANGSVDVYRSENAELSTILPPKLDTSGDGRGPSGPPDTGPAAVYKSLYWASWLLATVGVAWLGVALWGVVGESRLQSLVRRAQIDPGAVPIAEINSYLDRTSGAAVVALALIIGINAAMAALTYRLYGNVPALDGPARDHKLAWALGGWFVPIMNLFRPKQIIDEVWVASSDEQFPSGYFRVREAPGLLVAWWVLWLVNTFVDRFVSRASPSGLVTLDELARSSSLLRVGWVFELVTAMATLAVFGALIVRQSRRARILELDQGDLPNGRVVLLYAIGGLVLAIAFAVTRTT